MALQGAIAAMCARPIFDAEPGGGTGYEVDVFIGDEKKGANKNAGRGRVVLTIGDGPIVGPGEFAQHPVIARWQPRGEAHLWTPNAPASLEVRMDQFFRLVQCVVNALHERHAGWSSPSSVANEVTDMVRDPDLFRHGQGGMVPFVVSVPIFKGRPLAPVNPDASIGNVANSTGVLVINPEE